MDQYPPEGRHYNPYVNLWPQEKGDSRPLADVLPPMSRALSGMEIQMIIVRVTLCDQKMAMVIQIEIGQR